MSLVFTENKIQKTKQLIATAERIVVTSHKNPDGDAVGSALAMWHLLKETGKNATVVLPDEAPAFLQWMDGYSEIIHFDKSPQEALEKINSADLIFSLDYNHLGRTGTEMEQVLRLRHSSVHFIMIDHHHQPEALNGVIFSDTDVCSTSQMVYQFAQAMQWEKELTASASECIYCGIMTDSGSFRFPSVTAETHRIVATLIENKLDHARIHREVYDTNLADRLKLIGYALSEKLEVFTDCATALIWLSAEELKKYNHQPGDTEGLVNQALSIKGVKLAAFFREGSSEVKASFRSKGSFDVNRYARKNWRGGGHSNAAGGSTNETLEQAVQRFRNEAVDMKEQILNS